MRYRLWRLWARAWGICPECHLRVAAIPAGPWGVVTGLLVVAWLLGLYVALPTPALFGLLGFATGLNGWLAVYTWHNARKCRQAARRYEETAGRPYWGHKFSCSTVDSPVRGRK